MAEACQGHRGPGAAPLDQGLIQPQGAEQHARHHIARQDAGGGQLGLVDDDLSHGAQDAAAEKRVEIFHGRCLPKKKVDQGRHLTALRRTAWQMEGMDSPWPEEVGESSAPVGAKRMVFHLPSRILRRR